jgi:hypothetical protein
MTAAFRGFLDIPFLPNASAHEGDDPDWIRISNSTTAGSPSPQGEGGVR